MKTASFTATTLTFVLAAALAPVVVQAAPSFVAVELALPAGNQFSYARALNAQGDVAGMFCTEASNSNTCRPVVANTSKFSAAVLPPGAVSNGVLAVNDLGHLTGWASAINGFVYANGVTASLPMLAGVPVTGVAINNVGDVVGFSTPTGFGADNKAFLYRAGQMLDLSAALGAAFGSVALDINDAGQMVGALQLLDHGMEQAYVYSQTDGVRLLGTLGGSYSKAWAISSNGYITGYAATAADDASHAYLNMNGLMHDLGAMGEEASFGYGVNANGWVIGSIESFATGNSTPFLYRDGAMQRIEDMVELDTAWRLIDVSDINDSGQMSATIYNVALAQSRAVRLDPIAAQQAVPAPATASLVLAALALAAAHRRRATCTAAAQA